MTNKKYSGYSVAELLEDKEFISFVKSIQSKVQWDLFLEQNDQSRKELIKAREVIELFNEKNKSLDKEIKESLWRDINRFEKENTQKRKLYQINRYFRVAAAILIIAALGGLVYQNIQSSNQSFQFSVASNLKQENPLLILSNGKQIDIQKIDPNITVLKDQNAIQVDNDSILTNQPITDKTTREARFNEIIVPFGKRTRLLLSDGTKVWLNAGSRLAFPQNFDGRKREVFLEGEAIFDVAKNLNEPFMVHTKDFIVNVTGTVFNVTSYSDDAYSSAVLAEGKIELSSKGGLFSNETIHILPGTKGVYDPESKSITALQVNPEDYLSWRDGFMVIRGEKLQEILKKLSRYYNVGITLEDQTIAGETFSGRLDLKESPMEVLTIISHMVPLSVQELNNKLIIKSYSMSE